MADKTYYFFGYGSRGRNLESNDEYIEHHLRSMTNKLLSMFEWDFDSDSETMSTRNMELLVQTNGHGIGIEEKGKHYVLLGTLGGAYNEYYMPTKGIISNPGLNLFKEYTIDKDCVVFNNDHMYLGVLPTCRYYAQKIAENDISRKLVMINTRANYVLTADNDNAAQDALDFLTKLAEGKQGVITDSSLLSRIQALPLSLQGSAQTIIQLLEDMQYLKGSWWNEFGVQSNYNMKREAITANENILNVDSLLPLADNMLLCRQVAVEKYNKMFGTKWSVDFSSSWKKLRTEIKISQERDFGEKGSSGEPNDKSSQMDNKETEDKGGENNE